MAKKIIPKEINKTVKDYADRLSKQDKLPIDKVIIFGSYAKGKTRQWSDIDVCIISPRFQDSFSALNYLWRRRNDEEVRRGLEPVGFSKKDFQRGNALIREIARTGIEVKLK